MDTIGNDTNSAMKWKATQRGSVDAEALTSCRANRYRPLNFMCLHGIEQPSSFIWALHHHGQWEVSDAVVLSTPPLDSRTVEMCSTEWSITLFCVAIRRYQLHASFAKFSCFVVKTSQPAQWINCSSAYCRSLTLVSSLLTTGEGHIFLLPVVTAQIFIYN